MAKAAAETKTRSEQAGEEASTIFRVLCEGLYELRVSPRVVLDLLVTMDGELLTFLRVDGDLVTELPIAGQA